MHDLRISRIAGTWYTANPAKLSREMDTYLDQAKLPTLKGEVLALVAPHAGHRYSGKTAAHAFKAVQGQERDLVIVVSPFHAYHPSILLTSAHNGYVTPLGTVQIDTQAINQLDQYLATHNAPRLIPIANDGEHALEIELPFLQRALVGEFKLLPVMIRTLNPSIVQMLGQALAEIAHGRNCLLVASTDLSHFYPLETAKKLDSEMLRQFAALSPEGVLRSEQNETGFACGAPAVAAVFWAARALGADSAEILHYSTSADETGDPSSVVGYGAAAVLKHA